MIVLGVDPGVAHTGYGVVRTDGARMVALDGGTVETAEGLPLERRLLSIHERIVELIAEHAPAAVAVEDVYFSRNVRSALAVGQARGAALLAAAQAGIDVAGYTPQAIKNAVCGSGAAGKDQVQRMVAALLGLAEPPRSDHAADALAVAICHAGGAASRAAYERAERAERAPAGVAR